MKKDLWRKLIANKLLPANALYYVYVPLSTVQLDFLQKILSTSLLYVCQVVFAYID